MICMERGCWGGSSISALCCHFWLKADLVLFLFMSQRGGGELLDRPSGNPSGEPGSDLLLWLVVFTFLAGVTTGCFICFLWGVGKRAVSQAITNLRAQPSPWKRLTVKLLTFIRKRRLVGLAFHNYQGYSLRNQQGSKPTQLRRRRLESPAHASGLRPLQEGPAQPLSSHGSNTGRA